MRFALWAVGLFCLVGFLLSPGIAALNKENRQPSISIIGGTPVLAGEYPSTGILSDGTFLCAGTLIGPSHVLTAAQCLSSVSDLSTLSMTFNSLSITGDDQDAIVRTVTNVIAHEEYDIDATTNDVAIIVLNSPITSIAYTKLPTDSEALTTNEPTSEPTTPEETTPEPTTPEPTTSKPPTSKPPTSKPPTSKPPTSNPPSSRPPSSRPPSSRPPSSRPPSSRPPSSRPPSSRPPSSRPPSSRPPSSRPPSSNPPSSRPPSSKPPSSNPPSSRPPSSKPPSSNPPSSRPPSSKPPSSNPPSSRPPSSKPPSSNPPSSRPPSSKPPSSNPPSSRPPSSRPPSSNPPTSKPPSSKPPSSKPPSSNPPSSRPPSSKPPSSNQPTSKPPTSKQPTSKPPTSKPPTNLPSSRRPTTKAQKVGGKRRTFDSRAFSSYANEPAVIVGWGRTSVDEDSVSTVLLKANVTVLDNSDCSSQFDNFSSDNQICASESGVGACLGDNGGPLYVDDTQVGIYIRSTDCTAAGVFTRVTAYVDWITQTVENNPA